MLQSERFILFKSQWIESIATLAWPELYLNMDVTQRRSHERSHDFSKNWPSLNSLGGLLKQCTLERFSIESRKTKTKPITTANHNKENIRGRQWELEVNACNPPEARENVSDQVHVAITFGFASDWLRGWREFSRPITEHSQAKRKQSRITFDTQLKVALR